MSGILLRSTLAAAIALGTVPSPPTDIRLRLLKSARESMSDFPDGQAVKGTHFGYLGTLDTPDGPVDVVDQRGVIAGMLSPRGVNHILFFDAREKYLGKLWYIDSRPLWCEGGRVTLWGAINTVHGNGNVIDLSAGYRQLRVYSESAYGSSGGLHD